MTSPVQYIKQTHDLYDSLGYPPYQWFKADSPAAWTELSRPLNQSRLGMLSTAGTYIAGQVAYYYKDDTSVRKIPADTELNKLRFSHVTENYLVDARKDPRTVFPLQALHRLQQEGLIGSLADNYYSCMGGIYSQRRVQEDLIPNLRTAMAAEGIDVLLLVPL
ncbi:MAG: glycine/sarcosine/betaine reductase selenoprotein B family protein [Pseudomonadales bacterium]|jgi:D-proline reductase (dithiol) PrdB|nr:glycine/sarcosine/betaine reductase selenoprotein B family protein [Pseudomonadales bacterium]MDP7596946.1 glycine/sarcosine/betaine reductase selenoprotein B family protein [Pseudomonadales bacterium]HJN50874.1 glycine/sarcosine/betaine reductase selenoprotein B family protein [Pseudomonadales bacterium]|tara:strand:+ start:346 stop:834 length:489 start_codon:yes stop_codon:yes gene_type:complete